MGVFIEDKDIVGFEVGYDFEADVRGGDLVELRGHKQLCMIWSKIYGSAITLYISYLF